MNLTVNDNNGIALGVGEDNIGLRSGDTINIGTSDYEGLENKPSIESVTLIGDIGLEDIGAAEAEHTHVKADITDFAHNHTKADISDFAHTHTKSQITDFPTLATVATSGKYNDLTGKPTIPSKTSQLTNNSGFITANDIPPQVTDLGNIDPSEYEDDREVFLNTLLEDGIYRFVFEDGDDYEYYVVVESMLDNGYVYQKYWSSEEGSSILYQCSLVVEDGEVVERSEENYMTLNDASNMFAIKAHTHYESKNGAMSVFDWCDTSDLKFDNAKPFIIYTDTLNSKNWIIERYTTVRSPNYRFIKVYDMGDSSHFYMRSGSYTGSTTTWGNWQEYTTGGGGSSVFIAEYGVTSYQDILTALEEGKAIVCKYEMKMGGQTVMTAHFSNVVDYITYQQIIFAAVLNDQTLTLTVDSSDTWADVWGTNVTDVQVNGSSILSQGVANLSNVAVSGSYNDLGDKPEQTEEVTVSTSGDVTYSLEANKIYHFTGQISSLTLTLVATSLIPHYHFDFVSGTTQATFSISGVTWMGGETLTPNPSTHYEVDILNGRGVYAEFPSAR